MSSRISVNSNEGSRILGDYSILYSYTMMQTLRNVSSSLCKILESHLSESRRPQLHMSYERAHMRAHVGKCDLIRPIIFSKTIISSGAVHSLKSQSILVVPSAA